MSNPFFNSGDAMALQSEVPLPALPTGLNCSLPSVSNVLLFVLMELYSLLELNKKKGEKVPCINLFSIMPPTKRMDCMLHLLFRCLSWQPISLELLRSY